MEKFEATKEIPDVFDSRESIFSDFIDHDVGKRKIETMAEADDVLQKHFLRESGSDHKEQLDPKEVFAAFGFDPDELRKDVIQTDINEVGDLHKDQLDPKGIFADFAFSPEEFKKEIMKPRIDEVDDLRQKEFKDLYDRFSNNDLYSWRDLAKVGPNCYAFVLDAEKDPRTGEKFTDKPYPGMFSGMSGREIQHAYMDAVADRDIDKAKKGIVKCIKDDLKVLGKEFEEVDSKDYQTKPGERLISISASSLIDDFHFMRRGDHGTWYHKEGVTFPKDVDGSMQTIYDPEKCNRGLYDMFLGYYVIRDK